MFGPFPTPRVLPQGWHHVAAALRQEAWIPATVGVVANATSTRCVQPGGDV